VADVRRGLTQALQDDMLASYVSAVSETMRYGVNTKVFQQVTKSQGE
jgi:hypothetical protein